MISRDEIASRLSYDPTTGKFTHIKSVGSARRGACAGHLKDRGYVEIGIAGRRYAAHQLAWLLVYGDWPASQIDHVDGNRSNNAISNLRLCDQSLNNANTRKRDCNTSGHKGVAWHRRQSKWVASIKVRGRQKHLGYFDDKRAAASAYADAASRFFGEFARIE